MTLAQRQHLIEIIKSGVQADIEQAFLTCSAFPQVTKMQLLEFALETTFDVLRFVLHEVPATRSPNSSPADFWRRENLVSAAILALSKIRPDSVKLICDLFVPPQFPHKPFVPGGSLAFVVFSAIEKNDVPTVFHLLKKEGILQEIQQEQLYSPMQIAAKSGNIKMMEFLNTEFGIPFSVLEGDSYYVTFSGKLELIQFLHEKGVNLKSEDFIKKAISTGKPGTFFDNFSE